MEEKEEEKGMEGGKAFARAVTLFIS